MFYFCLINHNRT